MNINSDQVFTKETEKIYKAGFEEGFEAGVQSEESYKRLAQIAVDGLNKGNQFSMNVKVKTIGRCYGNIEVLAEGPNRTTPFLVFKGDLSKRLKGTAIKNGDYMHVKGLFSLEEGEIVYEVKKFKKIHPRANKKNPFILSIYDFEEVQR